MNPFARLCQAWTDAWTHQLLLACLRGEVWRLKMAVRAGADATRRHPTPMGAWEASFFPTFIDGWRSGWSGLHYAADAGNVRCVNAWLDLGLGTGVPSDGGETALAVAAAAGHADVMVCLARAGMDPEETPLHNGKRIPMISLMKNHPEAYCRWRSLAADLDAQRLELALPQRLYGPVRVRL